MRKVLQSLELSPACHRHVARVMRTWPGLDCLDLLDALVAEMEMTRGPLAERSVAVYRHEYRLIIQAIVSEGFASERDGQEALTRISDALGARVSAKVEPRTSARKAKSISARDLKRLFNAIKAKALAQDSIDLALVGLLTVSFAVLGVRPVELTTLERAGSYMRVQNAKRGRSATRYRIFDISKVPETWSAGIMLASELYGTYQNVEDFYRTHRRLSQLLARISEEVLGRRICFYSLRHVAMATWKRAGIDAALIALLAGHICLRTARHYAPASSGHSGPIRIRPVAPEDVPHNLFNDGRQSELIKGSRSPKRRAGVLHFERGANSAVPANTAVEVEVSPALNDKEPLASETTASADSQGSAVERELAYRRKMLALGVRTSGPRVAATRTPRRDDLDIEDLPVLPTPPKFRQKRRPSQPIPQGPDPEFDALMDHLIYYPDDDPDPESVAGHPDRQDLADGSSDRQEPRELDPDDFRELGTHNHRMSTNR